MGSPGADGVGVVDFLTSAKLLGTQLFQVPAGKKAIG